MRGTSNGVNGPKVPDNFFWMMGQNSESESPLNDSEADHYLRDIGVAFQQRPASDLLYRTRIAKFGSYPRLDSFQTFS
jgi:hypothetical protein